MHIDTWNALSFAVWGLLLFAAGHFTLHAWRARWPSSISDGGLRALHAYALLVVVTGAWTWLDAFSQVRVVTVGAEPDFARTLGTGVMGWGFSSLFVFPLLALGYGALIGAGRSTRRDA